MFLENRGVVIVCGNQVEKCCRLKGSVEVRTSSGVEICSMQVFWASLVFLFWVIGGLLFGLVMFQSVVFLFGWTFVVLSVILECNLRLC